MKNNNAVNNTRRASLKKGLGAIIASLLIVLLPGFKKAARPQKKVTPPGAVWG